MDTIGQPRSLKNWIFLKKTIFIEPVALRRFDYLRLPQTGLISINISTRIASLMSAGLLTQFKTTRFVTMFFFKFYIHQRFYFKLLLLFILENMLFTTNYCCEKEHQNDEECTPNIVPDDDPVFRYSSIRCMNSTRPLTYQDFRCTKTKVPSPVCHITLNLWPITCLLGVDSTCLLLPYFLLH